VRKVVTVLFCDLVESTPLGERLDPESLRRVMARWHEAMRTVLERHGCTVEKFVGDAVSHSEQKTATSPRSANRSD